MRVRIIACFAAVLSLLFIAGCKESEKSGLTIKKGVLQVGMEVGYPPMEYLDEDGVTPIGFDVEMAEKIAEKLGLELQIHDTAWDGIFASLDSNRYDCIISAVSITPDRQEEYNLTEAYVANKLCIVTAKNLGIKSPDDLKGHKVAVQTETTANDYIKEMIADGKFVEDDLLVYDKIIQSFDELKIGRVDAVLVDNVVASYYIGDDKDDFSVVWTNTEAEPMAVCLKKGNDELTEAIDRAVDEIYEEGAFEELANKHFGEENTVAIR